MDTLKNNNDLIKRLVSALHSCQELIRASQHELRIYPVVQENNHTLPAFEEAEVIKCNNILKNIADRFGLKIPQLAFPIPKHPLSLETGISKFCGFDLDEWRYIANSTLIEINDGCFAEGAKAYPINYAGMPSFNVYSQGKPDDEAIIIIPPCGVPVRLFEPWLDVLGAEYYTIIVENPFLFGDPHSLPDPSGDIGQEVDYIGAILKKNNISRAHLVGICGGAPIALAAATRYYQQVASIIVCHGDLNFGSNTPRSIFQNQFQGLLSEAVNNISRAQEIYTLFLDPAVLFGIPNQLCPFVLYPYSDFRLFQRYAKINSGLMAFDATKSAQEILQPVMIFTSRDDRMTLPQTSHLLHQMIKSSVILERESGSHHDVLLGNQEIFFAISQFLNKEFSQRGNF